MNRRFYEELHLYLGAEHFHLHGINWKGKKLEINNLASSVHNTLILHSKIQNNPKKYKSCTRMLQVEHTQTHFNLQNVISSTLGVFCSALKIKVNWCRCFSIPSSGSLQIPNDIIHMQTTPLLTFSKLNLHLFTLLAFARSPSSTYRCCHAYGTLKWSGKNLSWLKFREFFTCSYNANCRLCQIFQKIPLLPYLQWYFVSNREIFYARNVCSFVNWLVYNMNGFTSLIVRAKEGSTEENPLPCCAHTAEKCENGILSSVVFQQHTHALWSTILM